MEMLSRQYFMGSTIHRFQPDVVASLMGSYSQTARLWGCKSLIFTDSEFQHFNHLIANPFADEIHTPYCFYKTLGKKQISYRGFHELSFLNENYFSTDPLILKRYPEVKPFKYIVVRLSAWNTFHDIHHKGIGPQIYKFINQFKESYRIIISAEEDELPEDLKQYAMGIAPEDFHHILGSACFVLTEGASTASEAACLGIPTVYINSTEPRGYLLMLEKKYGLVRNFSDPVMGISSAINWLETMETGAMEIFQTSRGQMMEEHCDVCGYVVKAVEGNRDR